MKQTNGQVYLNNSKPQKQKAEETKLKCKQQ
jgi:hypothetical protein